VYSLNVNRNETDMRQKKCSSCEEVKSIDQFAEREDAWGHYSWCEDCRKLLDRDKLTKKQAVIIEKTQLFHVRK